MSALCPQSRNGECAAEDHLAIALHRDRIDSSPVVSAGKSVHERVVGAAIRIQTSNMAASGAMHGRELPPNQYFPIRLDDDRLHATINGTTPQEGEIHISGFGRVDRKPGLSTRVTVFDISRLLKNSKNF